MGGRSPGGSPHIKAGLAGHHRFYSMITQASIEQVPLDDQMDKRDSAGINVYISAYPPYIIRLQYIISNRDVVSKHAFILQDFGALRRSCDFGCTFNR